MKAKNPDVPPQITRFWHKPLIRVITTLLIIIVCIGVALPFGLKLYLQKWLVDNGAETAVIKSIRINPFLGSVSLKGADIKSDGQVVFSNSSISLDIGLATLFNRKALLERAVVSDVVFDVERFEDGSIRLGSYTISGNGEENPADKSSEPAASPWIFQARVVEISNVTLHYSQPDLDLNLVITEGTINRFSTGLDSGQGAVRLSGTFNQAPFLLDLDSVTVLPEILLSGTIDFSRLDLQHFAELLKPYLSSFTGLAAINGKATFHQGKSGTTEAEFDGGVQLGGVDIAGKDWKTGGGLNWKGRIGFSRSSPKLSVKTDGRLDLKTPEFLFDSEPGQMQFMNNLSSYEGSLSYIHSEQEGTGGGIEADGLLTLETTTFSMPEVLSLEQGKLKVEGKVSVGLETGHGLRYQGSVDTAETSVMFGNDLNVPVTVTIPAASLKGVKNDGDSNVLFDELGVSKLLVDDKQKKQEIATFAEIKLLNGSLTNTGTALTLEKLTAGDGVFLRKHGGKPLATLASLNLFELRWKSESGFFCDRVNVDSLFAEYLRENQEKEEQVTAPGAVEEVKVVKEVEKEPAAPGLPVTIATLEVTGHSGVRFTDTTLQRPFTTELLLETGKVEGLDLTQPDKPFTYELKGAFDGYAPLVIKGKAAPLAEQLMVVQETTLRNYSLQQVSPYVVEAIGTFFESGRLDLTSTLKITGENLDLDNTVVFKDLHIETVDSALAAELDNQLPVPLDMAISMLKDSKGNIDLDVPITGSMSDLSIGITDVLVLAMSKAITLGVAPYLAYTFLGPTGAIVFLGATIGTSLLDTSLPPMEFDLGDVVISEKHHDLLQEVGNSLQKNGETIYSICAKVALSELGEGTGESRDSYSVLGDEKARKQLFKLGNDRSLAVKVYLQEKFSIPDEQLMLCNPGIEHRPGEKSVVEFKQ